MIKSDVWLRLKRLLLLLFLGTPAAAPALEAEDCRPLQAADAEYEGPARFDEGLLWKLSKDGAEPSWLFGTIHVGDAAVLALPAEVDAALEESGAFAMEVLPDPMEMLQLAALMRFDDGRTLPDIVSASLYRRTVEILAAYHLPEEIVAAMKPWAAFLTMSYPPDMSSVLDLHLFQIAQQQGDRLHGLETMAEQGAIFNDLALDDQVQLLADTVCHYDVISGDFERMKELYLERDLKGLYMYGQRHAFADNALYERLTERLLIDRNKLMAERMVPLLGQGGIFVAVGAMHLPGEEGLLNLLRQEGFTVERAY